MGYRVLADENIERAAVYYLRKLDHDVEWIGDVPELGLGVDDVSIAAYARENDRLILTQDVDFLTELDVDDTEGVLFQTDQTLSARAVGDIIHEMSQYINQSDVTLEYVTRNWLLPRDSRAATRTRDAPSALSRTTVSPSSPSPRRNWPRA